METQDHIDFNDVIDTLINTFGEVLSRDVIFNIVENLDGNLEQSANAIMNIVMDENNDNNDALTEAQPDLCTNALEQVEVEAKQTNTSSDSHNETVSEVASCTLPGFSYAEASLSTKPPVHLAPKPPTTSDTTQNFWTEQLKNILLYHESGARTLILMRGLPGSGKTYLAKKIIDAIYYTRNQHYHTHILSTDDYFMHNGVYMYDKSRIPEAHEWNQNRARKAMTEGLSPVIIDNTNIEIWEMEFYVVQGVKNGYTIEVVEPNTPWAKNAYQLSRRNSHNVPLSALRRKLDYFLSGIGTEYLMNQFKLQYSHPNIPPVLRITPSFSLKLTEEPITLESNDNATGSNKSSSIEEVENIKHEESQSCSTKTIFVPAAANHSDTVDNSEKLEQSILDTKYIEIQKYLEEMEKVEKEWDNGEDWEDNSQNKIQDSKNSNPVNSKPQRRNKIEKSAPAGKLLTSNEVCQDWSRCSMFLPSWGESSTQVESSMPVVEKKTSSTCIEYGDTDISTAKNPLKIITGVPRNINEYHVAVYDKKMPEKWMLDKSTSTNNNQILTDIYRCQNEEQHFAAFRKLFKNIARSDLRDIFDNCYGDVNWAVEIVLDGVASNQLDLVDSPNCSDTETEEQNDNVELCQCLSAYDIIPHSSSPPIEDHENVVDNAPSSSRSKGKKDNYVSESSMQLKRQIEQNVVISDNHYSEHCLKIRKFRRGEFYIDGVEKINEEQSKTEVSKTPTTDDNLSSIAPNLQYSPDHSCTPSTSKIENAHTEIYDEDSPVNEEVEKTVNVNLGKEFIAQLDAMFGRRNMDYPASVVPKINMPVSLLNEINALWMESLMNQLEEDAKQSEIILQQDEEFARQLAIKEAELLRTGKEPEVPDFKEIMDMDFALSLYHKDVADWRSSMPVDLAAKLTRDKLYNLFPDVPKDILSELLMAHDNNFQETVEGLLISTGKSEILETKNGVSKFVMQKEMERQEKLLEEEKKDNLSRYDTSKLYHQFGKKKNSTEKSWQETQQLLLSQKKKETISEVEWPLLPKSEQVDMSVVQRYRDEAEKHLQSRNTNYQKAEEYIRRGITQVATYYSEIAAFHKEKYELANSMAAATLMQVHAANASDNATIDLHYLRVGEAKESVDLFIDTHIQKLREVQDKNSVKFHTLFFITGRGLHSNGRPRIKPAVKKRLAERGLAFSERNPGLLTAKVCADDKLSHQVA